MPLWALGIQGKWRKKQQRGIAIIQKRLSMNSYPSSMLHLNNIALRFFWLKSIVTRITAKQEPDKEKYC